MKKKYSVNWLNLGLGLCLLAAGVIAKHIYDWFPGTYTGWSFAGFGALAAAAAVIGVTVALSSKQNARWPGMVILVIGLGTGIGATVFAMKNHIQWWQMFAGLATVAVIGGLLTGISVTRWQRPYKAARVRGKVPPPPAP